MILPDAPGRGRVIPVIADKHLEHLGRVRHSPGERAGGILGDLIRDNTGSADEPKRRADAHDAVRRVCPVIVLVVFQEAQLEA